MQIRKLEAYFIEIIKRERNGFIAVLLRFFLLLASGIYKIIVSCRNWVFDHGWLRRYCPPVPLVISVGNIVVGGTGKTPVTLLIAKEFSDTVPLAILSRGYRSKAEKLPHPTCLCSGKGQLYPASFCGDEPYLLAQNLPNAHIFVGRNRHNASVLAAKSGAKLILLDDGMQHRQLSRDLDVVVMDGRDLFGQNHFLPRGFLRESKHSLSRAHLIVINHIQATEQFNELKARIAPYTSAPTVGVQMQIGGIFDFKGEKIESLAGKKVGIFCGIAHPDYFEKTIQDLGGIIVNKCYETDHSHFDHTELEIFSKRCRDLGAEWLICTEKDRVKFNDIPILTLPTAWIKIELVVVEGKNEWQKFIAKAKNDMARRI